MDLLLDTHAFIWFINGDSALPQKVVDAIKNVENKCFISIASLWEIAIKSSLKKLELKSDFDKMVASHVQILIHAVNVSLFPDSIPHHHLGGPSPEDGSSRSR